MAGETPDFAQLWNEAMDDIMDTYKDARRQAVKDTTRPLEGEKMTPEERRVFNQRILGDELMLVSEAEEMAARFQLSPGTVPRRLWDAVKRAAREEPEG